MTLKRSVAVALLSSAIVFGASGQSGKDRSQTLFTINKKPISTEEFIYLYRKNHQHKPEEFTEEKIDEYLNLFVNYKLKVEEALSRGLDTTRTFKREYETYRQELLKPYLPDSKIVDSMVMLTYARLQEEVNASHILIAVKPDAPPEDTVAAFEKISALRERALGGEDFGALAAAYSEEPGAKNSRGNLGFFTAMQMVYPFEQAAWRTPVGGVSPPVRTQFGYHIVNVLEKRPSSGEVEVSHIMIRTGDGIDDNEAKNNIFDIYDKLQKGVSWEELCLQYSEDPNSRERGGRLRPFGVGGMSAVPEFQEMAFSLEEPGQISDPFQTRFGWHILRLESKIPLPPFEELKASLTQRVSRDERVQISRKALRMKMRRELGYEENEKVKAELIKQGPALAAAQPAQDLAAEVLFTLQGKPYSVSDFLAHLRNMHQAAIGTAGFSMEQAFTDYVDAVQLMVLEENIKSRSPDYKWLLKEYYEGILLFEIMEKEVWNKAMEDTTGQRQHFERQRDAYMAGERMAGKIYSSATKEYLWKLKELINLQDTTVSTFLVKNRIREEAGTFEKSERPVLQEVSWSPGAWLAGHKAMHYLVVIEEILPAGRESFEEARASVISDYQEWLEQAWIGELKRKFGVTVEKRARKQAIRQLMGR